MRNAPTISRVPLNSVIFDPDLQTRVSFDKLHIREFRDWLADNPGQEMDPVRCVFCEGEYLVWDGGHRHEAYTQAGRDEIPVEWTSGTKRDAILLAVGANQRHGLKRSDEDKHKAVGILLADPEWSGWSNRAIADATGVSESFVRKIRGQDTTDSPRVRTERTPERVLGRDGVEQRNPAYTKASLKIAVTEDRMDDVGVYMERGEEWRQDVVRLAKVAGRFTACRPHLDAIQQAMHELRKALA